MGVYIANKPVRFDKNYKVGEIIPDGVIDPRMTKKLIEMGRILYVDVPADKKPSNGGTDEQPDGNRGTESIISGADGESALNGHTEAPSAEEFSCGVCGRVFKTQNALAAHLKSHKN